MAKLWIFNRWSIWLGTLAWVVCTDARFPFAIGTVERLLLLAPLVLVPLALRLVVSPDRHHRHTAPYRWALGLQPIGAACALLSFTQPYGWLAGALASVWLLVTICIALFGLYRFFSRPSSDLAERCIDIGLLYIVIGGAWLVAARMGWKLGYPRIIVLLTAVHFHFAGLLLPVFTGLVGRLFVPLTGLARWLYRTAAWIVILGPPLVALGIALFPLVEVIAAWILAGGATLVAVLVLWKAVPQVSHWMARVGLVLSGLSLAGAMIFASVYALGEYLASFGQPTHAQHMLYNNMMNVPAMIMYHGQLNALGFGFCGFFTMWTISPSSRLSPPGMPFSKLSGSGGIGPTFFERHDAVETATAYTPTGLIDGFDDYQRDDLDVGRFPQALKDFYERTQDFDLQVRPHWKWGFRTAGRLYFAFAQRLGQMALPTSHQDAEREIHSQILNVKDSIDGRTKVRAWIRTFVDTGKAMYVAAYSSHITDQTRYMNIAFPLPGGQMTSILHLEADASTPEVLRLTTLPRGHSGGDQGVYFVHKGHAWRLPINETITVWTPETPAPFMLETIPHAAKTTLLARHEMWCLGIKFLELDYWIAPST